MHEGLGLLLQKCRKLQLYLPKGHCTFQLFTMQKFCLVRLQLVVCGRRGLSFFEFYEWDFIHKTHVDNFPFKFKCSRSTISRDMHVSKLCNCSDRPLAGSEHRQKSTVCLGRFTTFLSVQQKRG